VKGHFHSCSIFIAAFLLFSCSDKTRSEDASSIFGSYSLDDTLMIGYSGITLNSDCTYVFGAGMCVGSSIDSGNFSMHGDTLLLNSALENKIDTANHGFDQVTPLTGEKYLVSRGKIFYRFAEGNFDSSAVWIKQVHAQ
jgi:hypothetical protein